MIAADVVCEKVNFQNCVSFYNDGHGYCIHPNTIESGVVESLAVKNPLNPISKEVWP